jgi:hypothetical protein
MSTDSDVISEGLSTPMNKQTKYEKHTTQVKDNLLMLNPKFIKKHTGSKRRVSINV